MGERLARSSRATLDADGSVTLMFGDSSN